MAEKVTAKDAERIVVQLKADFNTVAGKTLKMSKMLERLKEEELVLAGQLKIKASDVGAQLEALKLRFNQVIWNHELADTQRQTHEHVIARIRRATIESAAEVDTLREVVAAAGRQNDGELAKAQIARDQHALANEKLAAKEEEYEVIRGGYADELAAMKKHSLGELEVYAYHDERNASREALERRLKDAQWRLRKGEFGDAAASEMAQEVMSTVSNARFKEMEQAFDTLTRLTNTRDVESLVDAFVGQETKRRNSLHRASELESLSKRLQSSVSELQTRAVEARMGLMGGLGAPGGSLDREAMDDATSAVVNAERSERMAADKCLSKSKLAEGVTTAVGNLAERLAGGAEKNPESGEWGTGVASGGDDWSALPLLSRGRARLGALERTVDAIVAAAMSAGIEVIPPHAARMAPMSRKSLVGGDDAAGRLRLSRASRPSSRTGLSSGKEQKSKGQVDRSTSATPKPPEDVSLPPPAAAVRPLSALSQHNVRVAPSGGGGEAAAVEAAALEARAKAKAAARFLCARRAAVLAAAPDIVDASTGRLDLEALSALCRNLGGGYFSPDDLSEAVLRAACARSIGTGGFASRGTSRTRRADAQALQALLDGAPVSSDDEEEGGEDEDDAGNGGEALSRDEFKSREQKMLRKAAKAAAAKS